jgi:hypothetical protein
MQQRAGTRLEAAVSAQWRLILATVSRIVYVRRAIRPPKSQASGEGHCSMKLGFLFAAMCLASGSAFAQTGATSVNGDWIGKGSFQYGPDILACSEIKMKFVGTPVIFGVRDGSFVCESSTQAFPMNDDFDVKSNNDVYYKGQHVGAIVSNKLTVLVPGPDETGTEFTLRREGELLFYNEVSGKPGQPPVFGMVAIMKQDPNAGTTKP